MNRTLPSHTTPRTNRSHEYAPLAATLLLAACGALASCGDGDDSSSTTASTSTGAAGSGGTGAGGNTGGTGAAAASGGTATTGGSGGPGATGGSGGMSTASGGTGGMGCVGPETCLDVADEDCDGLECGLWGRRYGDTWWQFATDSAVLPSGEVYFSGSIFDWANNQPATIEFSGDSFSGQSGHEGFFAKLSPLGEELWIRPIPVRKYYSVYLGGTTSGGVAVYIPFEGVIDLGGGPLLPDALGYGQAIAVYSADGTFVWAKTVDGGLRIVSLATSPAGKVVLAGSFSGDSSYDGQMLTAAPLIGKCLFEVDEQDGSLIWAYSFESSNKSSIAALTVDAQNNVLLVGQYKGLFNMGGQDLPPANPAGTSGFFGKLDGNGNLLSAIEVCHGSCGVRSIVSAPNGDLYLGGWFSGFVQFGPNMVGPPNGYYHSYVTKLTPQLQYPWIKSFTTSYPYWAPHLAIDANGNVTFAVQYQDHLDVGFEDFPATGAADLLLGKLATDGTPLWARHFGAPNAWLSLASAALGLQPDGGATLAFNHEGSVDFGFGPMTSAGQADIAVVRFAP